MPAGTAVVLFRRDLRVTDNPALWGASRVARTVPLFVLDDAILGSRFAAPNRVAYMREALIDLDGRLRAMDARLFLRRRSGGRGGDEGRPRGGSGRAPHRRRLERPALARGAPHAAKADHAGDARLSAHIRWGCVSPREVAAAARAEPGGAAFVRQLCWRDFHHQVLAAFPDLPRRDYRPRGDRWSRSERAFAAWREGRTEYPLVDAGMRRPAAEGKMHNRARLAAGSFLTKDLDLDWRKGARQFWDLLTDGEVADDAGNWLWVAGTGNDTRPQRVLNPVRQAERFDPDGVYVRRWVTELTYVRGKAIFRPWLMEGFERLGYPPPIVDHDDAVAALRARRRD